MHQRTFGKAGNVAESNNCAVLSVCCSKISKPNLVRFSNSSLSDSPLLPDDYEHKKNQIVGYLRNDNSRIHAVYALRFVICEILNFFVVVSISSECSVVYLAK